jgi:hypothetical protein
VLENTNLLDANSVDMPPNTSCNGQIQAWPTLSGLPHQEHFSPLGSARPIPLLSLSQFVRRCTQHSQESARGVVS